MSTTNPSFALSQLRMATTTRAPVSTISSLGEKEIYIPEVGVMRGNLRRKETEWRKKVENKGYKRWKNKARRSAMTTVLQSSRRFGRKGREKKGGERQLKGG